MDFRHFKCSQEERNAENIIMQIDRGEYWIFKGADNSEDFGGFIHRLYFQSDNTFGVFCACVFCDNLRFIIGFNDDIPEYLEGELIDLIVKTREQKSTRTSICIHQRIVSWTHYYVRNFHGRGEVTKPVS